ncbi:MAG: Omp28 family outer membrane lipoprotein [Bacteroidales bacterium]
MNRILITITAAFLLFSGCDIVEAPYKKEGSILNSTRKILLEDYTGHQCPNCPQAGKEIHNLQESYGDNIVFIAVHAGSLAKILIPPTTYNFTTEVGDIWCDYFEVEKSGYPNGLINRKERSGSKIIPPANWATVAVEQINMEPEAEILLNASYDQGSRKISVTASSNILSPVQGEKYYLTIVLTEDSIIRPQRNGDNTIGTTPYILDYAHNHVLRFSLTPGAWGVALNPDIIDQKSYTQELDITSDIKPENCNIVAFISKGNRDILQAEQVHLISR